MVQEPSDKSGEDHTVMLFSIPYMEEVQPLIFPVSFTDGYPIAV